MTLEKLYDIIIDPIEGDFIEGFFEALHKVDEEVGNNILEYKDDLQEKITEENLTLYLKDIQRFHFKCTVYFKALGLWSKSESSDMTAFLERFMSDSMADIIDLALIDLFMGKIKVENVIEIAIIWSKDKMIKDKCFGSFSVFPRRSALISLLLDLGYLSGVKGYIMKSENSDKKSLSLVLPKGFESTSINHVLNRYLKSDEK